MAEKISEHTFQYANYKFEWGGLHLPLRDARRLQHEYDELASEVVERLQALAQTQRAQVKQKLHTSTDAIDLYALLRQHYAEEDILQKFWSEVHAVPEWVDWAQIERGQKFFYRYAMANIMGFVLQGFIGENTAASSTVEVLVRTGGFSVRALRQRLMATFQLILQVSESIEALQPGGSGHSTAVRVRLLHSSVRNRIMKLAKEKPDYFDLATYGPPANHLDSIHSIATFAANHMWLQLPQMGVFPTDQDKADYIALWRYVGYLLGTPDEYFASVAKAKATMESMLAHELRLTPTSHIVCHNFLEFLTDLPPFNVSADFIAAGSRKLNGDQFCDDLGMARPGGYAYACFQGQCWMLRFLALVQQNIPSADRFVTNWFKAMLHKWVIHSKSGLSGGSKMGFKHVPRLDKLTTKENAPWAGRKISQPFLSLFTAGDSLLHEILDS
ncbi:hypothetical protein S40293_09041 [Stachybotrys chartarum IBT 40293]|nr:hypothetical protein S40293_09041 [Stachybotrys chartarum IBT 40293]